MSEAWQGADADPNSPVTITLPYSTMKRILTSVTNEAYRMVKREDENGVRDLSTASEVIGDAINAPSHRRFRRPEKYYHAVIAGNEREYRDWLRENPELRESAVFVDSVDVAKTMSYSGSSNCGTAYRRSDFQELIAAVKARTFRRSLSRA